MPQQKASLKDILNYEIESYLTEADMDLIRTTFKGNTRLLQVLRKVFLPSVGDSALPIEEIGKDVWLTGLDYSMMQNEEIKSIVLARQDAIKFVAGGIMQLKYIANEEVKSKEDIEAAKAKDSTR